MKNSTGLLQSLKGKERQAVKLMALRERRRRNRAWDSLMKLAMEYPPQDEIAPGVDPREKLVKMLGISPEQLPKSKAQNFR